jgi:uncharacterized protein YejL (UPF0352 family)
VKDCASAAVNFGGAQLAKKNSPKAQTKMLADLIKIVEKHQKSLKPSETITGGFIQAVLIPLITTALSTLAPMATTALKNAALRCVKASIRGQIGGGACACDDMHEGGMVKSKKSSPWIEFSKTLKNGDEKTYNGKTYTRTRGKIMIL